MCPSIGLNKAVMVVGGCDGGPRGVREGESETGVGTWNDGGVASGRVVNRIPVETVYTFTFSKLECKPKQGFGAYHQRSFLLH